MDNLSSHAPEALGLTLLLLTVGLLMAVWAAVRRRETWRVRWLCLLYASLALTTGAGFPLCSVQPTEQAANVACAEGAALVIAGVVAALWTAFGAQAARPR